MSTVLIVLSVATAIWALEHLWPNVVLPKVNRWYLRAAIFNAIQAISAVSSVFLWDVWFANLHLYSFDWLSLENQVLVGYATITFIYYWWHRLRHANSILWRFFHQFHHSPARIEVITSFYKHPAEILANGLLTSFILYVLLGLSVTAVGLSTLLTGLAELIYHMNVKTPRILGLFFQRPEMHRIHHQRGLHHYNYSDLPIWDMLFGTYRNPAVVENLNGFPDDNENKLWSLLTGQELTS